MNQLRQLVTTLEQLAVQAAQIDRRRSEHHQPLFDETLFHCKARLLVPCVKETQSTLDTIIREQESGRLTSLRAEYLTERLYAQVAALQREIATQPIRKNEPKHYSHYQKPINVLYQELAQHQDWERRLMEMVRDKLAELETAPPFAKQTAQQTLLSTEQRLERCRAAKLKIEKQITYRERHQ
ncbi:primosomal replication protein N'' [Vibrio ichthyoenteri ATCC 700023]|uniref:Primosomal replication protein N n=1 Tax=Vibrio ichthyoenteri ATCC 700023 TaxID=870968 RepID=F9S6V2_9VIBR|nr:primosomal replication protein [Vibrio ichthyoenteri]EGU32233.1 primosomal replication protein N'' [Vibrio ichthyoenteri ATCC 700023]